MQMIALIYMCGYLFFVTLLKDTIMSNKTLFNLKSGLVLGMATLMSSLAFATNDNVLNVYNWNDYEAPDTVSNFEKQTNIHVVTDYFDTNEVLEAKLLAGKSGYDLVFPGSDFLSRQIKAGIFLKLDKSKIPNYKKLDPVKMELLSKLDPNNQYAIPYQQGTTGIGYNVKKIKEIFGNDYVVDSWDFIFKEENISRLEQCGVAVLNNPTEVFATALNYLGLDPNSTNQADYAQAGKLLMKIRPYIRYFHSSQYISDIASGDVCVVFGWSGDILQGSNSAKEANNGVEINYVVPKEGALVWYDMMAIPADAEHVDSAYKYMNYILEPKVIADISNYTSYSNAVAPALELVDESIASNPNITIPEDKLKLMFVIKPHDAKINKVINTIWTKIKSSKK